MPEELSRYFQKQWQEFRYFTSLVSSSLFNEPSANLQIVLFPFLGIKECFTTTKYGYLMFNIFLNYTVAYIASCVFYFYCIFPWTCLIYSVFFGPLGFMLAVGHGAIFCNIIACHETRVSSHHFMNLFFTKIVPVTTAPQKQTSVDRGEKESVSWRVLFIANALRLMVIVSKLLMWFAISLIPVFGTILVKLQSSAPRGFSYFLPYFERTRRMDKGTLKVAYYSSFGKWLLFGLVTGFLESVPMLAGFSLSTNACGCALWEVDHAVEIEGQ